MKNIFVKDLNENMAFIDFFMVKSISIREGANKKEYLDMTLGDMTGEVNAKKWDVQPIEKVALSEIKDGDIVKIKAQTNIWQGNVQLKVEKIRLTNETDGIEIESFVKAAPEKPEEMYNYLMDVAENMVDEDFRNVSTKILELHKEQLMYYPAASKNHHAELGGLLYHMKRMVMSGLALCNIYPFLNRDLVVTGVIIHDMEKINEIQSNEYGVSPGYSAEGQLLGHIVQGVRELDKLAIDLGVPREKAVMLEHMILSHHYEPEFGSPKKPMFPEAEMLHYLDVLDARMFDMEEIQDSTQAGGFSERIWTLDNRKLYKPTF